MPCRGGPHSKNLSDSVPVFGLTRTFCTAFYTASTRGACIGTVIGCIAFRTFPHQFINRFWMVQIRCGIWIYALALRTHHMGLPTGILEFTAASASDHLISSCRALPSVFACGYVKRAGVINLFKYFLFVIQQKIKSILVLQRDRKLLHSGNGFRRKWDKNSMHGIGPKL